MVKHGKSKKKDGRHKHRDEAGETGVPKELVPETDAPAIRTPKGTFDLDDPVLPDWIERAALASGGYPYRDEMSGKDYEAALEPLQVELVKLQHHIGKTGGRIVALFEGRDAAGKGGAIFAIHQFLNPRSARSVALPKPTERERGQWYFQRYVAHLPTAGEIVLFDRSWYNRAGVEPVMGFCTAGECRLFLDQVPGFEAMLVDAGTVLFKFWLDIGREMQLKQFHQRRHNPLKIWKLSPIDYVAMEKWDDYTRARDRMLEASDKRATPWRVVRANDKRRARLAIIRSILGTIEYAGKDPAIVGQPDRKILDGRALLSGKHD